MKKTFCVCVCVCVSQVETNVKLEECLKKVQQENEDYKARMDKHAALSKYVLQGAHPHPIVQLPPGFLPPSPGFQINVKRPVAGTAGASRSRCVSCDDEGLSAAVL